jgi:hypothetical protein
LIACVKPARITDRLEKASHQAPWRTHGICRYAAPPTRKVYTKRAAIRGQEQSPAVSIWINAIWKPRSFKDSQPTMAQVC